MFSEKLAIHVEPDVKRGKATRMWTSRAIQIEIHRIAADVCCAAIQVQLVKCELSLKILAAQDRPVALEAGVAGRLVGRRAGGTCAGAQRCELGIELCLDVLRKARLPCQVVCLPGIVAKIEDLDVLVGAPAAVGEAVRSLRHVRGAR